MVSRILPVFALLLTLSTASGAETWGYVIGEMRNEQQANICDSEAAVDELAAIFERFGPQTGFSALASSPDCALMVHSFTPRALQHAVDIQLKSGDVYTINIIRIELRDGQTRYVVTTRHLQEAN